MKLTGNTILVTGGGSGIGRALAEQLAARGNRVVIAGRRRHALDAVVYSNHGIESAMLDIDSAAAIGPFVKELILRRPTLNVVIHSAGIMRYEAVMKPAYPSELDRLLGLSAIQLEWDRAEPDGYANHMTTDPLPNTPAHKVLMQIALGDKQVSDYAADTEARTIGAKTNCPSFDDDRVPDTRLLWGVPCIESFPYDGSAIIYYDSGADLPVLTGQVLPVDGGTVI